MPKVCGTGGWGGPLPGDPDNNSILTASPAFGGIELEWTYPTTNPNAVAHVRLYRNVFPVLETAVPLAIVNGNRYYDKTNSTIRYYYWMRIQSINGGPLGEAIGPASAVGRPVIQDVITQLTGMIDAGVLAESLRSDIDSIATNYGELVGEIADRLAGDAALSLALANVQAGIDQAMSFIASEVTQRQEGETALITQIDSLGAVNAAVAALVQTETNARVAADAALASQITAAQVALGEQVAGVEVALQANIDAVDGEVTAIGALYTAKVTVNGLVGGFGVYNNGVLVEAGFDVDRFWIGRTNADKRKPFIVEDGVVYINDAVINKLTFSKLRDETGNFIVENGKLKSVYLETQGAIIRNAAGTIVLQDGVGNFSGALVAATGTFGGTLLAGTVDLTKLVGSTTLYTTPGSYSITIPAGFNRLQCTLIGGGGGGGNLAGWFQVSSGGGGGGYTQAVFTVSEGQTFTLTVGAGGGVGQAGGATTVLGLATAGGGAVGNLTGSPAAPGSSVPGGAGGSGTIPGSAGTTGAYTNGAVVMQGGDGGNAGGNFGAGGVGAILGEIMIRNPTAGSIYGGGGGGGVRSINSADYIRQSMAGAPGRALIEIFNSNGVVIRSEWATLTGALQRQNIQIT